MTTLDPVDAGFVACLVDAARRLAGAAAAGPVAVLSHRAGELVLRTGDVVVKAHASGTDRAALDARLALARGLPRVLLAPSASTIVGGRFVTLWPAGVALREEDLPAAPWEAFGGLLADLHRAEPPADLPASDGPQRVRRTHRRLAASPHGTGPRARAVYAALERVPAWMRGAADPPHRERTLAHGDFHLGQLVRLDGGWRLIDIDGVGVGDPVWDFARLAAWFAGGVIPAPAWNRFVNGYRAAGGPALPPDGDPWPVLDAPARALVAQIAGIAIVKGDLDVAETFVACCRRITAMYPVRASDE